MTNAFKCMFSPRLYKIYKEGPLDAMYAPNIAEKLGDKVITTAQMFASVGMYATPILMLCAYTRGLTYDEAVTLMRFFGSVGLLIASAYLVRGMGRSRNASYIQFLNTLYGPRSDRRQYFDRVRRYDFEFSAWPITFQMPLRDRRSWFEKHQFRSTNVHANLPLYKRMAIQALGYIATHTIGIRLIYPGALGIVNFFLWSPLFAGRAQLVENFEGQRSKVRTADGNDIDTMLVDNRFNSQRGETLVICCEGNSGFYEVGIMTTPTKCGYSALGWNHPGFASSTGQPFPSQVHHAIEALMQFAFDELGFKPENIIMYGWSIGGYSATWAAVNYHVKGLILDATFDDLLPLALNQMPPSWSLLVKEVVRSYVDLNIAELMKKYGGPVHLIRRTEDEIICLRQGLITTNRGNNLVIKIIGQRHSDADFNPAKLNRIVSMTDAQRAAFTVLDNEDKAIIKTVGKYMRDYRSSHCTPLPEENFGAVMDLICQPVQA